MAVDVEAIAAASAGLKMKRAFLQLVAAWREIQTLFAELHAHNALQAVKDADDELDRAGGWLNVRAEKLRAAQARRNNALLALQRHQRHRELGLL